MQLHYSLETTHIGVPTALTIGAFDGIHLGHQCLIQQVRVAAERIAGESVVLTFDPHPDLILHPERRRLYLTMLEERLSLLEAHEVDHTIVLRFDQELARVPAEEFMGRVCRAMALRELWCGPGFRLGAGGRGTVAVLERIGRDRGYTVQEANCFTLGDQVVSSTLIRQMLGDGRVDEAARLLGRPFLLRGEVVHGDHRGRTIGFATANIAVPEEQFVPADGVYACQVQLAGETTSRPAVTNVGVRPTFGSLRRTVEAHLLDWNGDLYGTTVRVAFVQRLRGEQKFGGIDELVAQIRADVATARSLFS